MTHNLSEASRAKRSAPPKEVLPPGTSMADWALEKKQVQNPRIRALLGCVRVLDEVLESNFAILHCSPRRIAEIWKQVIRVATTLRHEVAPLLAKESIIPRLEEARTAAEVFMNILEEELFSQLDRFPETVPDERLDELRKLLCVATGQLQTFLQDTLGELLSADPRSQHDADYFLSRRFALDVDESEWLHTSVMNLERYLVNLGNGLGQLVAVSRAQREERRIPTAEEWRQVMALLEQLCDGLAPTLRNILGLRGIRLGEMELLEHHTSEIPILCRVLIELYRTARMTVEAAEQVAGGAAATGSTDWMLLESNRAVLGAQLARIMRAIESQLRDLLSFVPVWRQGIEHRRALSWSAAARADNHG